MWTFRPSVTLQHVTKVKFNCKHGPSSTEHAANIATAKFYWHSCAGLLHLEKPDEVVVKITRGQMVLLTIPQRGTEKTFPIALVCH